MHETDPGSYTNILIIGGLTLAMGLLLYYLRIRSKNKSRPSPMAELMESLAPSQEWGLKKYADRYAGIYKGYPVTVFPKVGPRIYNRTYSVMVAVDPGEYGMKGIGGFFDAKYAVLPASGKMAYVHFELNPIIHPDPALVLRQMLDTLTGILKEKDISPGIAG